jgi:hypothetical protein
VDIGSLHAALFSTWVDDFFAGEIEGLAGRPERNWTDRPLRLRFQFLLRNRRRRKGLHRDVTAQGGP